MVRPTRRWPALALLIALHAAALLAGFLAPYHYAEQDRTRVYAPPTRLRLVDQEGRLHLRPFVFARRPDPERPGGYREDPGQRLALRLLVPGDPYRLFGVIPARLHLFGFDGGERVYLLGSDLYGRDLLSRILYGAAISLFAGLVAAALSLAVGTAVGAAAGYFGGWVDGLLMRLVELFMALPWLYLLLAFRAFLPLEMTPTQAFFLLVGVIGLIGWARPARLVRGIALSARERGYVLAARGFGASHLYLLLRHVLPQTRSVVLTQAAILIPRFILAEVTLSFLGLGVGEPVPSWGILLAELQKVHVLLTRGWFFLPALALVAVTWAYHAAGRAWDDDA